MIQKHRIRTEIGKDKKVTVELKQDFDLLEILSLKFTQQDIYSSFCADYGVVCGRISVNNGYGIANARVSIFVPLTEKDSEDPVISTLYPYTTPADRNEDNYRYNLLPSRKQHSGHTPTGTFPDQTDILTREEVLEVYEKYYKYTVKTNDSGDFMIWGVPLGQQTLHVDVDLSDMGCQSMVPYDFIYEGVSPQKFENEYTFMGSDNLSSLPQIVTFEKTLDVFPFWGNVDLCEIGITRTDFDLSEQGIRIDPYSIMLGGTFTDTGKDSVRVGCNVDNQMGEKCSLTTGEGDIEAIRFTGRYETNSDNEPDLTRPLLEAIQLDSAIDENGNFFFRVPMNYRNVITNEFGETVESTDPDKGIATRGSYRFRFSMQNDNGSKKQYRGKFLVPQIKEHNISIGGSNYVNSKSYAFSTNLNDYPTEALDDINGLNNGGYSNDYFYSFRYNRVYSVSSFINQYRDTSWAEETFSFFVKDRNESFIGIKEIQPSGEEDCANNNEYFPITDAVRNHKFKFLIIIILNFLERLYLIITQFAFDIIVEFLFDISEALYGFYLGWPFKWRPFKSLANRIARYARDIQELTKRDLGLINYPDCYECNVDGGDLTSNNSSTTFTYETVTDGAELTYINDNGLTSIASNITATHTFDTNSSDPLVNGDLTFSISGGNVNKNYIVRYVIKDSIYGFDPETGEPFLISPIVYGYAFIGYGSTYPSSGSLTFLDLAAKIHSETYSANGYSTQGTLPYTISGTALSGTNTITIDRLYFVSELTENSNPLVNVETGCQKYDIIYDYDNDMVLRAITTSGGTATYQSLVNNPDLANWQNTPYPDIFLDGNEDPCTTEFPDGDIIVSISKYTDETSGWTGLRDRRCALKAGHSGTASGYSEFRDGVYTLIAAAGKNRQMIQSYSRRKLLGKLMCAGVTSYTFTNSWLNGSLYFFQFRRRRGGDSAKFCRDLIYRKVDDTGTHYYYRSTPYLNNNFIGLSHGSTTEILFPTTVVDLGPRVGYINEICVDPELDVNCSLIRSTGASSYQSITDLMEYIIQSKEVKEQGKLQVQDLFDRRGSGQIDGDIAQLLNFNSQLGIYGYDVEDAESPYYNGGVEIFDGIGPVGVDYVLSTDDPDTQIIEKNGAIIRLCLNEAGNLTETAQEVPYYRWNKQGSGFGPNGSDSERQNWVRTSIYSTRYQGGWSYPGMISGTGTGFDPTDNTSEYIYDGAILPPIRDCADENYTSNIIPIGGPFFFYFGLRTGKTAWNKFIKTFGPL